MEAFQRVSSSQENTVHNKTFVVAPVQMILAPWWRYSLRFFLVSRSTNAHRFPHHLPAWYLLMHPSIPILEWKGNLTGTTWVFIKCLMCGARVHRGYNASAYGSFRHLLNLICQVTKMLRVIAIEQSTVCFTADSLPRVWWSGSFSQSGLGTKSLLSPPPREGHRLQTGWKSSQELTGCNWPEYVIG